jgi:hypothetical protein
MAFITSGSLYFEPFLSHDRCRPHVTSLIWCDRDYHNVPLSAHCFHSFFILDHSLIYYFALWFTLVVLSTIDMFIYYVARLRLLPLTETIHYSGPGFQSGYPGTGLQLRLATRTPNALISFGSHSSPRRLFECGICMEEMPDDSIARPDPCGHTFCRECLRQHVTTRLDEHRFPILCPTCTAGKGKGKEAVSGTCCERTVNLFIVSCNVCLEVSQSLALDLGLTDEQYSIWTEMEMAPFSVLLYCRK